MQRRFNYTNRVRILHSDVKFTLKEVNGGFSFDAILDLSEYDLPPNALVFVEAYYRTSWMRFPFGTVGGMAPPDNRILSAFDSIDDIRFRVKVTAPQEDHEDEHGLLLAEADSIRLRKPDEDEDSSEVLLPVVPEDLGNELWRIDIVPDNFRTRLLVNRNAGVDFRKLATEPFFVAFVYPSAIREILRFILLEGHRDYDDVEDPRSRWLRFAVEVLGQGEPPPVESEQNDIITWIDDAVTQFANKHRLLTKFNEFWAKEDHS